MTVLLQCPWENADVWADELRQALAPVPLTRLEADHNPAAIEVALVWNPKPGLLTGYPNLKAVHSLGAGVDALMAPDIVPPHVPIARLVDPLMASRMATYVSAWVLHYHLQFDRYAAQALKREWQRHWQPDPPETVVGVLGYGQLGQAAAEKLCTLGYSVHVWRRQQGPSAGATVHIGDAGLEQILPIADFIVCLLPMTPATDGFLNSKTLAQMKAGSVFINCARGGHVVENDLIAALDRGHIRAAVLDVFTEEPLPPAHPYWAHEKITVTPHISCLSDPKSGSRILAEQVHRVLQGVAMHHRVQRQRGY